MFEKLKDLKKARKMQQAFMKERHTVEGNGVKVTVNGSLQVEEILIGPEVDRDRVGEVVRHSVNQALREIQQKLAQQLLG